jgi:hypothetical protein
MIICNLLFENNVKMHTENSDVLAFVKNKASGLKPECYQGKLSLPHFQFF